MLDKSKGLFNDNLTLNIWLKPFSISITKPTSKDVGNSSGIGFLKFYFLNCLQIYLEVINLLPKGALAKQS